MVTLNLNKIYLYLASVLILGVILFGSFMGIKNYTINRALKVKEAEILKLKTDIDILTGEKAVLSAKVEESLTKYQNEKKRADAAVAKLNSLPHVEVPTTTTDTINADCLQEIQKISIQYKNREIVYIDVIDKQKMALDSADKVITALQDEKMVSDEIINKYKLKDELTQSKISSLESKITQTERKVTIYKYTSGGLLITVLILLL